MPVFDQERVERLKQILKWHPRGITISDLAARLEMNRNLVAKYLDILLISGQVEMQIIGASKVYFLSQRIPVTSMLEFSSDMLIILDGAQKIIQVNKPLLVQVNKKKEALTARRIREIDHPFFKAIPEITPSKSSEITRDQVREFECTLEEKKHYYRLKQIPTAFEDGSQGTTLIIEDITEQITYQKMLELNEAKYRGIIEDQTEFITRFLPDGTLVFVNDAYARYLGKDKEQLLGMYHIPDIESQDLASVRQFIQSLDAENPVVTFECRVLHSDGHSRWNLWTVRALFDNKKKPFEYQGVGKDNTEKREAATRINQYVRDLEFLSRKAQEFVAISADADIFQAIAQGLSELLPDAVISVNSYYSLTDTLTVRSLFPDTDRQKISSCLGREYVGFEFKLTSAPASIRTLALHTFREGKIFHTDESLYNFFFQQIPENICNKIKDTLNLGDRYYGIGLIRHGILFGVVAFSLRKGEVLQNSQLIETFIRQASIVLHRKYTDDALKASETKYRGIVEDQTEFVTRFLSDGTITYANDSLCRFFSIDRSGLLGQSIFSLSRIPPDDRQALRRDLPSLDPSNSVNIHEYRVIDPSSGIRWTQWTTRAFFDVSGTVTEYQGVGRDITDQKTAETRNRQYIADIEFLSQKSYEFLELSPEVDIYKTICKGVKTILPKSIVLVNSIDLEKESATTRILLGDNERIVFNTFMGEDIVGKVVKLPRNEYGNYAVKIVKSGKIVQVPGNLFIATQKEVPEEVCAKIEETLNIGDIFIIGLVSQGIILANVVIMLQKGDTLEHVDLIEAYIRQAANALLRQKIAERLRESEKLYRSVVENIQDVFYRSDKQGTLIMASPSWAQLLGYDSLDDCIGYNIAEKFYFEPHRRKEFLDAVYSRGSVTDYEVVLKCRDGNPVLVSTNSHLYFDDTGELLGVEGIFRDIRERHDATQKMKEQIEQMDFFSRKLQDFIELSTESDIFQEIGAGFHEIIPDTVISVNSFDPGSNSLKVRAMFSEPDHETLKKIIGKEVIGTTIPLADEELANIMKGKVNISQKKQYEILFENIAPGTFDTIQKSLNIEAIYSIGLIWQGMLLGSIIFALKKGDSIERISLAETFARAASIALKRKFAEDALKESEEIFSSVAKYAPVPIAIIEPDGTYRYINQKFTETFGYDLNDFRTGKEWFSLAYPELAYRKNVIAAWKSDLKTYKSGIERPERFTVRCKNGIEREIVFRPVTLANRKQFVVYEEITDGKKSENLQKLLSLVVEATSDAVIGEKNDGTILSWNGGATQLFGYTKEEALGHHISLIIPPEYREENNRIRDRIKTGETVNTQQTRLKRKDGRLIDVEVTLSLLTDENGMHAGLYIIAHTISLENLKTQQNEGEEDYKGSGKNTTGEDFTDTGNTGAGVPVMNATGTVHPFHLSSALKMARDYIVILDRTGKCIWVNDAFAGAVHATNFTDLEGKNIALFIAPEFRKIALDSLMEIKKSGNKTVQLMMLSSSGRVPVEANFSAINTEGGDLFGYMAIARNIERNRVEKPRR